MSYSKEKIPGSSSKEIVFFSLSTCFWCGKAKEYLEKIGVGYDYVLIDSLPEAEQQEAIAEMSKYNPGMSFPTLVVANGEKVIIGFNQAEFDNLK